MRSKLIILFVLFATLTAGVLLMRRAQANVTISDVNCATDNATNIVTFTARNKTGVHKRATVEITVYSEKPNGIATDPVVAGVETFQFVLSPRETRTFQEPVRAMREPLILFQRHPADVRVLKTENESVQQGPSGYREPAAGFSQPEG